MNLFAYLNVHLKHSIFNYRDDAEEDDEDNSRGKSAEKSFIAEQSRTERRRWMNKKQWCLSVVFCVFMWIALLL